MKKILFLFFFLLLILFLNFFPSENFKKVGSFIREYLPESIYSNLLIIFDNQKNLKKVRNDYNDVFLPNTQYLKIDYKKLKLNFINKSEVGYHEDKKFPFKSFFIENYKNNLFILDRNGNLSFKEISNIKKNDINFKKINSNLKSNISYIFENTLDFEIFEDKIFLSKVVSRNNCYFLLIDQADLNYNFLNFENIFTTEKECMKNIQAGKIEALNRENLLLTTAAEILQKQDETDIKPQDDKSLFGKIIMINFKNKTYEIFNKGHRNSLGLIVEENFILSTENGPRGGDEINLEIKGKNYGWDLVSYGEKYKKEFMYLDHEIEGYQEPIIAFIPSLALSEIIKLDNNFSKKWQNNYLIGSLYGGHLLRVRFNKEKTKVIYIEKIFVGERIRDLDYDIESKMIFLALETSGSLGILRANEDLAQLDQ